MLEAVKAYLKITWDDEDADLEKIIDRGKARIKDLIGIEPDFDATGLAQELLLDYCRYAYNNASEYFEENFQKEILRLQLTTAAAELAVEADDD